MKTPGQYFAHYTEAVDLAFRWADPHNPFPAHTILRPFLAAAAVPRDTGIEAERIDRQFWLGEVLDAIKADAKKQLPANLYRNLEAIIESQLQNWDHRGLATRPVAPPRAVARFCKNPAASKESRDAAIEKFTQFHRYPPTKITEFKKGFSIPHEMVKGGAARWTTYSSAKVDPATLKKPRGPVNYIHEHDAGVCVYLPVDCDELEDLHVADSTPIKVPRAYYGAEALVRLGTSLGFCIKGDKDGDYEFEANKGEELYCVPDGTCLLIVADRRKVVAMIWGGALGVFGRGIDG